MFTEKDETVEVTEYLCATCKGNTWCLYLSQEDGHVFLYIACSNPECTQHVRHTNGWTDGDVIWDKIDVTHHYGTVEIPNKTEAPN